jgi:hypothetical protein
VWLATARLRALFELAADERALAGTEVRTYGRTLIKLADRMFRRPAFATSLHLGGFAHLRRRVAALHHRSRVPTVAQLAVVAIVGGSSFACAGFDAEDGDERALDCDTLKQSATVLHDRSEKGEPELRTRAASAYDEFFSACQDDPDLRELLYYRAELTWARAVAAHSVDDADEARALFAEAHDQFVIVLEQEPGRFTTDAALAQLLAKRNELGVDFSDAPEKQAAAPREPGTTHFPRSEYSRDEEEILASFARYEAHVRDLREPELQQVLLHRARLAAKHNRFDEAEVAVRRLLDGSDGAVVHVRAAEILTDVLTIHWIDPEHSTDQRSSAADALEAWLDRVSHMALYQLPEATALREAVPRLDAGLAWKAAAAERDGGDPAACAATLLDLAERMPDHERLDAVLLDAARCQLDAGDEAGARLSVRRLVEARPRSELVDDARALLR